MQEAEPKKKKITATGNKGVIGEQECSSNHAKMGITPTWVPTTHQCGGCYIQKLCRQTATSRRKALHSIPKELHLKKLMLPGPFSCPLRNQNSSAREGLILPPLPCIHFVSTVQRGGQDFRWRGSPIAPPLSSMPSFSTANCEIKTPPLVGESNYTLFFAACTPFLVPIRI